MTTLRAAYFYCKDCHDLNCGYIDLAEERDFQMYDYYFVDNAQLSHDHPSGVSVLRLKARCICFAFSPIVSLSDGYSTFNVRIALNGK